MFGHRPDGEAIKKIDPIIALTPHLMPTRCDAQVALNYKVPYEKLARYIVEKGHDGYQISFMELIIAAFVRVVGEVPEINRFIANKRIYARTQLTVSFAVLQNTETDQILENTVKCYFDPYDTIFDVAERVSKCTEANKQVQADNSTLRVAKLLLNPILANIVVAVARLLDRYGFLPGYLLDASPFHTSMFITNMASIGMPSVHHHIYNFGTTSLFWSLGVPEKEFVLKDGKIERQRYIPLGAVIDERIAEGAVFAKMTARLKYYLSNPELLETKPEKVLFDEGHTYSVPVFKKK